MCQNLSASPVAREAGTRGGVQLWQWQEVTAAKDVLSWFWQETTETNEWSHCFSVKNRTADSGKWTICCKRTHILSDLITVPCFQYFKIILAYIHSLPHPLFGPSDCFNIPLCGSRVTRVHSSIFPRRHHDSCDGIPAILWAAASVQGAEAVVGCVHWLSVCHHAHDWCLRLHPSGPYYRGEGGSK